MPYSYTLLACQISIPIPTPAWLQYQPPHTKQDLRVGTTICVLAPDGITKGPSGLITGAVEVSPCWIALTGWDDEMRTAFLLMVPWKWTTHPPSRRGFLPLHPNRPMATDFPIPIMALDRTMRVAAREWLMKTRQATGERRRWIGLGGVRISVETRVVAVVTIPQVGAST